MRRRPALVALGALLVVAFVLVELLVFRSYGETERTTRDFQRTTDATTAIANLQREGLLLSQAVDRLRSGEPLTPARMRRGLLERQIEVAAASAKDRRTVLELRRVRTALSRFDAAFEQAYGPGARARPGRGREGMRRVLADLERQLKETFDETEHALYAALTETLDERARGQLHVVALSAFALLLAAALAAMIRRAIRGDFARAYAALAAEASEREALQQQLWNQAMHDPLTGLGNRAKFTTELEAALATAGGPHAVLFIDLDGFKAVNDSLGHDAGDQLLCEVARQLGEASRPQDELARLGGDEFALLLRGVPDEAAAVQIAGRLGAAIASLAQSGECGASIGASVGVALGGPELDDADELISAADLAMYAAKRSGKGAVRLYEPAMRDAAATRVALEDDLGTALDAGELELHYQPIVDLTANRPLGFEALIRWRHPTRGLLPPGQFLEIAEDAGLIVPIGRWVLETACREARSWETIATGDPAPWVSVNLAPAQLHDALLVEHVRATLRDTGLDARRLVVELSERTALDAAHDAGATLAGLRELGVRIALDDFGTASTSLTSLRFLAIGIVKLDKSFVDRTDTDEGLRLAEAVLELADRLGLDTIAEGVEEAHQVAALSGTCCAMAQGYHFSRPVAATDVADLLMQQPAVERYAA